MGWPGSIVEQRPASVGRLRAMIREGVSYEAGRVVHTVKLTAAMCGEGWLKGHAATLEQVFHGGHAGAAVSILGEAETACRKLVELIGELAMHVVAEGTKEPSLAEQARRTENRKARFRRSRQCPSGRESPCGRAPGRAPSRTLRRA